MSTTTPSKVSRSEAGQHVVTVRGNVSARDGTFVGEFVRGRFLEREPLHF